MAANSARVTGNTEIILGPDKWRTRKLEIHMMDGYAVNQDLREF